MTSDTSRATPTEAGREMDVLIAQKVFGWTWQTVGSYWDRGGELYLVPPEGTTAVHATTSGSWDWLDRAGKRRVLYELPSYSDDIGAAWLVVEKLRRDGWTFGLNISDELGESVAHIARFQRSLDADADYECADTSALAICKAALAALEASHV